MSVQEKVEERVALQDKATKSSEIVLYNDDVNTFDHVIDCLIATCEHTPLQAEQCSLIVHYNGKCTVKTGNRKDLEPRCKKLQEAGLSAELI